MSENKEILCPRCGSEMECQDHLIDEDVVYFCNKKECPIHLINFEKEYIIEWNQQTQSRIDRAVEEAVRKERERVEGCVESILVDAEQAEEYHKKVTSLSSEACAWSEAYAWSQVISNLKRLRREISATY